MAPTRPRPLTLAPYDYMSEKAVPAIIVTPSSPLSATDYQIQFLPIPQQPRRRPLLASLFKWRFRRAAPIQLPTSAHETSFPIDIVPTNSNKTRRNRVLLLLAIPLVILIAHFLMAFAAATVTGPAFPAGHAHGSVWGTITHVFVGGADNGDAYHGIDGHGHEHGHPALHPHAKLDLDPAVAVVPGGMVDLD
ncbi:hypothetical protein EXIGLDRAFT_716184 [Exidia glandulosa HHB12029]|uniref:Uncharacterized protein n=1 Tax=Exidia glandulosa HHB12029 TaxID=1314781 RepID=A0A165QWZ9_EXIGL|nr:hypothetical protein EXIGLDRAFT_716184 [Exidia glandulosa HHB12029]